MIDVAKACAWDSQFTNLQIVGKITRPSCTIGNIGYSTNVRIPPSETFRVRGFQTRDRGQACTSIAAAYVVDRYYKVESFGRTLYHLLGIDPDQTVHTLEGRPMRLVAENAHLIREALA
jgi:hypothetical protein